MTLIRTDNINQTKVDLSMKDFFEQRTPDKDKSEEDFGGIEK